MTSPTLGLFPDMQDVLYDLLGQFGTTAKFTDDALASELPTILITDAIGGQDDKRTDRSTVDIDVFAGSITEAKLIAEQVRQFLINKPHQSGAAILDRADTASRPARRPELTPNVYRVGATYRVSARRMTS